MSPMSVEPAGAGRRRLDTFTVCVPGVEPILERELADLGVRGRRRHGGVAAEMTTRQLYAANLQLRTATRVVVRVARFQARSFAVLERSLRDIDWSPWLDPDTPVTARATSHRSRLWHTGAVVERLLRAAPGQEASDGDAPQVRVMLRLVHDQVTVSVDSSGDPLHRRGWRRPTAKAPLRATLAAAMLLASGWDGGTPLVDPFCGSGTIPIEAALLARRTAPGLVRAGWPGGGFAFQRWPAFEPGTWASVLGTARATGRPGATAPVVARDRDRGAVAATLDNAARAGVADDLDVAPAALSDLDVAPGAGGGGWLVTNPPYGRRIRSGRDLRNLYARLGQVVATRLPDWRVGLLVADVAAAGHTGLALAPAFHATNGGIEVRFLLSAGPGAGA